MRQDFLEEISGMGYGGDRNQVVGPTFTVGASRTVGISNIDPRITRSMLVCTY